MATSTVQAVPKLYDVIMWLMGRVEKFPRSQKFTLGDRIVNISLDTLDVLIEATYTRKRLPLLMLLSQSLIERSFSILMPAGKAKGRIKPSIGSPNSAARIPTC